MALLRHLLSGRVSILEPEHLVGRSAMCSLQIAETYVSSHHAVLRWMGSLWEIKDLGSRNGTFVNAYPLRVGKPWGLDRGDVIAFGEPGQDWELTHDDAPRPMVIPLSGGPPHVLDSDVNALPSTDDPKATVFRGVDGRWRIERRTEPTMPLEDQSRFEIDGRAFRLSCPVFGYRTQTGLKLEARNTRLIVGAMHDGRRAGLRVENGGNIFDLGCRPHHDVVLTLARHRLSDTIRGMPDSSAGWAYEDDLATELGISAAQIHVDIFRVRREVASLGIPDPADVIERRPRSAQLRLGIGAFEVEEA
jgi:hypothetical protein